MVPTKVPAVANNMPRPKGPESKPIKVTEKIIDKYFDSKIKNPHISYTQQEDREHFLEVFLAFKASLESTIKVGEADYKTDKFKYTPRQMFDNIMTYWESAIRKGQPVTVMGTLLVCRLSKDLWYDILNEKSDKYKDFEFMKAAHDFVEYHYEYSLNKRLNPAGSIFALKNLGWKDKLEIEASATKGALTEEERQLAQKRIQQFSEMK